MCSGWVLILHVQKKRKKKKEKKHHHKDQNDNSSWGNKMRIFETCSITRNVHIADKQDIMFFAL